MSLQTLIEQLADPDPDLRDQASDAITQRGAKARPALIQAVAAVPGYPHQACCCASHVSSQAIPRCVRQLLFQDYGKHHPTDRIPVAEMICPVSSERCAIAMTRLVEQDPSEQVRWSVIRIISQHMDAEMSQRLRDVDLAEATAPLLATAARRLAERRSCQGALALLQRVLELEETKPSFDDGAIDFGFDLLISSAKSKKNYDQAAQLLRMEAKRQQRLGDNDPAAVFELFALHAQAGPLAGFDDDLKQFETYAGRPQTLYALSVMERRLGNALMSLALEASARSAGLASQATHYSTAIFLASHEWLALAQRELAGVLSGGGSSDQKIVFDLYARMRLSTIVGEAGDDTAAADHLREAVEELRGQRRLIGDD